MRIALLFMLFCLASVPARAADSLGTDPPNSVVIDQETIKKAIASDNKLLQKDAVPDPQISGSQLRVERKKPDDFAISGEYRVGNGKLDVEMNKNRQRMIDQFIDDKLHGIGKYDFQGAGFRGRVDYGYARRCGVKKFGVCVTLSF